MGFIKSWFTPDMPAVPAAPPTPKLEGDREARAYRGGRASTILAGDDEEAETVGGSKMLLGSGS